MDVDVAETPAEYDDVPRRGCARSSTEHRPRLRWKPGVGLRVPEEPDDVAKLRGWVRALHDAGYVADQYGTGVGVTDRFDRRVLAEELGRSGIPSVLGNPLVGGAIAQFGTDEQKQTYLPRSRAATTSGPSCSASPTRAATSPSLKTRAERERRPIRRQRTEGVEHLGPVRRLRVPAGPHRAGPGTGRNHRVHPRHAQPGRHDPAVARDHRDEGLQRGVPRRRRGTGREHDRRTRRRLARRRCQPRAGARRCRLGRERWRDRRVSSVSPARAAGTAERRSTTPRCARRSARSSARSRIQRYLGYAVATRAALGTTQPSDAPTTKIWFSELNLELSEYALMLQGPHGALVDNDAPSTTAGGRTRSSTPERGRSPAGPTRSCAISSPSEASGCRGSPGRSGRSPATHEQPEGSNRSGCSAAA